MNDNMKQQIQKLITSNEFSGVVSIRQKNKILFESFSGYQDIDRKIPVNIETRFGLASGAKTFTAIGILKLEEENKLHIHDTIDQFLPLEDFGYDPHVTIKHLLNHTSGIPDYLDEELNEDLSHIPWNELYKPKDYFKYFPKREMDFKPGERFKYNNGAYIILAHIIDIITGDYHNYIHTMLEMYNIKNTKYYSFDNLPQNTAKGYVYSDQSSYTTNEHLLPIIGGGDGGIFSNVSDLHMVWEALIQHNILSESQFHKMSSVQANISETEGYGLGVWIKKNHTTLIQMIGQDQGVSFYSSYDTQSEIVTTIISNNDKDAWKIIDILKENSLND